MKNIFKNERGFSLAEMVVASGIVAIGGAVLMKTGTMTQLTNKKTDQNTNISLLVDDLVQGTSSVLSKSENSSGKKIEGICPLVSTTAGSSGVGAINISLENASKVFTDSNWSKYLTSWTKTSSDECVGDDDWSRCYKVNYNNSIASLSESEIESQNIIASVSVSPVNMNPYSNGGDKLFKEISKVDKSSYDAKDIGFEINAIVYFNDHKGNRQRRELKDFFWAPNVGLCDYTLSNGDDVKLSLNGSGASDPEGNTVYNRSGFTGNLKEPIDINWEKAQAQAGIITNNGNFITTDTSLNIFGSCNEVKYRCPQLSSNKREYNEIKLYTGIQYNKFNELNEGKGSQNSYFNPQILLKKGEDGNILNSSDQAYSLDGKELDVGKISIISSSHTLDFSIKDKNSKNANKICRSVCSESNNYNTNDLSWENRFTPYLSAIFSKNLNDKAYSYSAGEALGCTACYMKNCSQYGIGTFGPMQEMPTHPLDSSLPECSLQESSALVNTPAAMLSMKKVGTPWSSSTSKCMSASLNNITNELEYYPEDCSKKLPVLCYNFGGYVLAKDISGTKEALSSVNFSSAPRRCFEMGNEVTKAEELNSLLDQNFKASKDFDGNFDFINLSNQGIFLAPQFKQDVVDLSSWFLDNGHSLKIKFWVAAVRDGPNSIIAHPPFAPDYNSKDNFALYFDASGVLKSQTYPTSLNLGQNSGDKAFLLSHHIKFKGLFEAASVKPRGKRMFAFLCRKVGIESSFFVSKNKSFRFSDGTSYCNSEGGFFIPPVTPVGWVSAMTLVNPLADSYGYPDPDQTNTENIPLVWVGMKSAGSKSDYYKNWYFADSNLKNVGNTVNYSPSTSDEGFTVIDSNGDYINPRAELTGSQINNEITIGPGKYFQMSSSSHSSESMPLNNTGVDLKLSVFGWGGLLNSNLSGASFALKSVSSSKFKMMISGKKPGPGHTLKLLNNTVEKFGFNYSNRSASSPQGYHLCFTSGDGRVILKSYYDSCNGSIITKDQLINTKSGQAIFNLMTFGSNINIDLPE